MHWKTQRNERNLGFADNVNAGVVRANGEYICVLNQDTKVLHQGWADEMLWLLTNIPNAGIVGPMLIFPNGGGVQSAGGLFDGGKGPFHRYLGWKNLLDDRLKNCERVPWITGACFMMSKEDFLSCGGLRGELYPVGYFEDVHLCMQMRIEHGKEVWYCPRAILEHSVGSTGGTENFMKNSRTFHKIWDDYIVPDVPDRRVNY